MYSFLPGNATISGNASCINWHAFCEADDDDDDDDDDDWLDCGAAVIRTSKARTRHCWILGIIMDIDGQSISKVHHRATGRFKTVLALSDETRAATPLDVEREQTTPRCRFDESVSQ